MKSKFGVTFFKDYSEFRVLAPLAKSVSLLIYDNCESVYHQKYTMEKDVEGIYYVKVNGYLHGKCYTYLVDEKNEVVDPYAVASSINSLKGGIVDLSLTDPKGFRKHRGVKLKNYVDAVIYEAHIKDFTYDKTSGSKFPGKYLGFTEKGTTYNGFKTGIDHLVELGITHVALMPIFDFVTVDEDNRKFFDPNNYNWGYDPELYNVPEGSYATNPNDLVVRIKELKSLILQLHKENIGVIMDVVYNHTYKSLHSNFNVLYPNYYYRQYADGRFSDGAGCGSEIASERKYVKQFILESLLYWLEEYKVDGFRFDLMALLDIDSVNEIVEKLKEVNPDIIIYGEPWVANETVLDQRKLTLKGSQYKKGFAFFNDNFRDGIKGNNDGYDKGFILNKPALKHSVMCGIVGSIAYDDDYIGFTENPNETINYINSHDNLILYDKILKSSLESDEEKLKRFNKFALSILFVSQGVPFIVSGNEFLRSKQMDSNSYKSSIEINKIDWSLKEKNSDVFNFVADLITLRKQYPQFRLTTAQQVRDKIKFLDTNTQESIIAYTVELKAQKEYLVIILNGSYEEKMLFSATIKKHLSDIIDREVIDITLKKLFGMNGFIKHQLTRWSPYGIITRSQSLAIWNIKINKDAKR